ncbi:MAG: carbon starvation protein CstA [Elusimicrobia bacterium RIFCSPLOWO2_01_FULL_64_13]|nr:MAG: carbon starvation protein CstA [Elusimicrobia bacterium RIFCSPLOWO2_01_FULL_64_13]
MSLPLLTLAVIACLIAGYGLYGRFIASQYSLNDGSATPAVAMNDGADFVPARPFYLLGQHFSAIAAAGPIAGPIIACQAFGWLPCLLWIVLGVVFIGAVHDFSSLIASVRHKAMSIAEIVRRNLGERSWSAMMLFIWIALLYVIIAFTDITAATFTGITEEFEGGSFSFNPGGAVAAASVLYLGLALAMGTMQKKWDPPLWLMTAVFVPATLAAVWLGTKFSTLLIFSHGAWTMGILAYCFAASLLPLWLLLQPRGYLGGFVLYMALAVGLAGIFFGGFEIRQPAFKSWNGPDPADALFPFLFVTIACGACSGFHGLVCSGTTSKQVARESDCRMVGYGGMLLEGFVAVIALATVMIVAGAPRSGGPGKIYGDGMGRFLTVLIGEEHLLFAVTFGAMAFSTFIFDTLDVATRLGRYILQELFGWTGRAGAAAATGLTVGVPLALLLAGRTGSYRLFWTLFGASNQLLAALTLLGITVWLKRAGKRYWFTLAPMVFVMGITLWSLWIQVRAAAAHFIPLGVTSINGAAAAVRMILAATRIADAVRSWSGPAPDGAPEPAGTFS